jgi:endonuclease/exonuclease/phosphatase family metal-dependent hydrolase
MKIAVWNIMHGELVTPSKFTNAPAALAHAIASFATDINAIQEVDHFHPRTDSVNQSAAMATAAGHSNWAFLPLFIVDGERVRNIVASDPQIISSQNPIDLPSYGITITSEQKPDFWLRKDFIRAKFGKWMTIHVAGNPTKIFARDHSRAALAAIYEDKIVINSHLSFIWPFNALSFIQLLRWGRELQKTYDKEVFIAGDFNLRHLYFLSTWKSHFSHLTFPVWKPDRQIDYLLSSQLHSSCYEVISLETSDHCAIVVEI